MTSRKNKGKVSPRSVFEHRSKYDPNKDRDKFKRHNNKRFADGPTNIPWRRR